jgi:hypothetical protein
MQELPHPATRRPLFAQLSERLVEELVALGHRAPHHQELERRLRRAAGHPLARRRLVLHRTSRLTADLACPGLGQLNVKGERRLAFMSGVTPIGDGPARLNNAAPVDF